MLPAPSQQSAAEESKQKQNTRRMISSNPPDNTSMVCFRVWILNVFDIGTFRDVIATISIRERHLAKACASSFVAHSLDCGGCEAHVRVHVQLAKTYTEVAEAHKVRAKPPG